MSKNLNTKVRAELAYQLVHESCLKKSKQMIKDGDDIRKRLEALLHFNLSAVLPEIKPARYAELIQSKVLQATAKLGNAGNFREYYTDKHQQLSFISYELGQRSIITGRHGEKDRQRMQVFCNRLTRSIPGLDKVFYAVSGSWNVEVYVKTHFPAIPAGGMPEVFAEPSYFAQHVDVLREPEHGHWAYMNNAVWPLHERSKMVCQEVVDMLGQSYDMYLEILQALEAVRTVKALQEQFPEACKFLPEGFANPPDKAIADPKVIKDIREKLKKGLPV